MEDNYNANYSFGRYKMMTRYREAIRRVYAGYMQGICKLYVGYMLAICWLYVGYMLAICWLYVNYMQEIARLGYGKVESSELTMDRDNSKFRIHNSNFRIVNC